MKFIKSWAPFVIINAAMLFGIFAWQVAEVAAAGNLVQFVAWFIASFGIIAAIMPATKPIMPRGRVRTVASWIMAGSMSLLFAAIGHFGLGAAYAIGAFGHQVWRERFDADGHPLPDSLA